MCTRFRQEGAWPGMGGHQCGWGNSVLPGHTAQCSSTQAFARQGELCELRELEDRNYRPEHLHNTIPMSLVMPSRCHFRRSVSASFPIPIVLLLLLVDDASIRGVLLPTCQLKPQPLDVTMDVIIVYICYSHSTK
ncbi:unnamed protein product [Lymnaea stagnalis]|uniref:Uncharacterized protein n=1 Tax=Lymnaea stagnalis TaxID=6523 RepID=A0AAV2IIX3_LYMST